MWGRGWGEGEVGSLWKAPLPSRGPQARWWGRQVRKLGTEVQHRSPSRRQIPQSLRACSLLPHKGQKGTWEETGPSGGAGWWEWAGVLFPQGCEAAFAPEPHEAPGRCAERAGTRRGERRVVPLPLVSPDL